MERVDWVILAAIGLVILDGLMTLPNWHLEGNPVVLAIGPVGMMAVKIFASSAFVFVWFSMGPSRTGLVPSMMVVALFGLYTAVVLSNIWVLIV